jgi:glycosyltransferase involved in cell wall biosynthesis
VRVAILTQYYPPEIGAPQARLSSFARSLRKRSHDVVVLTAMPNYPGGEIHDGYGGFLMDDEVEDVPVVRSWIYASNDLSAKRLLSYMSFVVSSLVAGLVRLRKIDVLVVESPPLFLGMSAYVLSRILRARLVMNVSDLWPDSAVALGFTTSPFLLSCARALERFCYRSAHLVTGQTEEIIAVVEERVPNTRTLHFGNGVDLGAFEVGVIPERATRHDRCTFIYVGLHGLAQGLDAVLDAISRIEDRSDLRFVFVGTGPVKDELIEQARRLELSEVEFRDPVTHDHVPALLAAADVAFIPLKTQIEGAVPSKLYEAMAAGLPVILAAAGEATSILADARCGITVPPGDPVAIAGAITTLARDGALRERMGRSARAAVGRYDRRTINERVIDELESIAR